MRATEFSPAGVLRNPHLQSLLASSSLRRFHFRHRHREVERASNEHILDCGSGVRLQGFHAMQSVGVRPRGLVVLLHGWEGSARSSYMLNVGSRLLREGYDVFRLNLRDHGDTHHLNREIFHSCRIDEVVGALAAIARRFATRPLTLAGFSLGGNFALRVALRAPARAVPIERVVAICPAIRPRRVLEALERGPWIYHAYFMGKWRRSLKRKQELFPDLYRFDRRFLAQNMRELTAGLIARYTDFPSLEHYLDGYGIQEDRLRGLALPTYILTAQDDPVIPVEDFHALQLPAHAELEIAPHGGHCGFIADWSLRSVAEDYLLARLQAPVA
jgi:hypothetical protein